jgi:L-asparaginase II
MSPETSRFAVSSQMSDPPAPPVLVEGTRNGVLETRHRGHACLTSPAGAVLWQLGDAQHVTYPRSALKLLQVLPLLLSGAAEAFGFSDAELAIMCASHSGEPEHLAAVRSILQKCGGSADELQCGACAPLGGEGLLRGAPATVLHNNCSGKHAGFLAYCRHTGADARSCLAADHPLQVAIRAEVRHFCGLAEDAALAVGVDGCSAPAYALPLAAMARAFGSLAAPQACARREAARARVCAAVTAHPFMVAGSGRFCTALMGSYNGSVVGKVGAEGFYAAGLPGGLGLAVKMEDGARGPQYSVVCAVLEGLGLLAPGTPAAAALADFLDAPILTAKGVRVGSKGALRAVVQRGLAGLLQQHQREQRMVGGGGVA